MKRIIKTIISMVLVLSVLAPFSTCFGASVKGDMDSDGKIELSDVREIMRLASSMEVLTEEAIAKGDMDSDGVVTIADVKKALSKAVDIDPSTLSRWKKGLTVPDKYHLRLICEYFHIAEDSLRTEFLFLDLEPVTTQSKKNLCKEWIDQMSPEEFDALFPALKKLIK